MISYRNNVVYSFISVVHQINCFTYFLTLQVTIRLAEFRELVKEVVRSACRTALLEVGFVPDEHFTETDSQYGG